MNLLRYFKKNSCDGGLPNPIGLLSTRMPSQAIICANREIQAQSGATVSTGVYMIGTVAYMNKNTMIL